MFNFCSSAALLPLCCSCRARPAVPTMRRAACVLLWLGTAAGARYHPVTPGDEVCVVITGYNTADTVGDAVASVLQQTHQNLKVVFVDDGSRDATRCAVEQELAGGGRDHAVIALRRIPPVASAPRPTGAWMPAPQRRITSPSSTPTTSWPRRRSQIWSGRAKARR